jgi:hypothetical protein
MVGTMYVGIITGKPSQDFIRPLRSPTGLKSLLHTLNAIVHPTKDDLSYCFSVLFLVLYC